MSFCPKNVLKMSAAETRINTGFAGFLGVKKDKRTKFFIFIVIKKINIYNSLAKKCPFVLLHEIFKNRRFL